jgi:hypothetical protein
MSYIINKTDGTTLVTLDPGVLDQSTSLYLIGKNYPNYGELQQENFVRLLENFANSTEPNAPLTGQLWYDTDAKKIKYYDGTRFKAPGPTVQATQPNEPEIGDQWWDTTNDQMFLYDGTNWLLVGPLYSKLDAKSGPFVEKLFNVDRFPKRVVSTWLENSRRSILSSSNFISNVILPGFQTRLKSSEISELASLRFQSLFTFYSESTFPRKALAYISGLKLEISHMHFDFFHLKFYLLRNYYISRLNLNRLMHR